MGREREESVGFVVGGSVVGLRWVGQTRFREKGGEGERNEGKMGVKRRREVKRGRSMIG